MCSKSYEDSYYADSYTDLYVQTAPSIEKLVPKSSPHSARHLGVLDDNAALGVAPSYTEGGAAEVKLAALAVEVLAGRGGEAGVEAGDAGHVAEGSHGRERRRQEHL
jgi:hypothetical protein